MRSSREMQDQVRATVQHNLSKMVIALIVMMVITTIASFILSIPLVLMLSGNLTIGSMLGLLVVVFISEFLT